MKELFKVTGLAVNSISYPEITIHESPITFLTGPSGCGKSTLFRVLNGTLDPEEGAVLYQERDIRELDPLTHRQEVSLVSQEVFCSPERFRKIFGSSTNSGNFHRRKGRRSAVFLTFAACRLPPIPSAAIFPAEKSSGFI